MANWWDSPASQTTAPVAPNPVTPAPDNNLLTYYQRQMAARPKWTPSDAPYSLSAPSLALSAPPDTQAPTAPEAKAPEAPGVLGSTWNALKGAGVEALKTTQSIGPALYGLADTATGGYLDIGRRRLQAGIQNALGDDTRWQDIDPIAVSQQRTGAMQDELKPDQYRQWEQDVAQQQGAWDKTKATLSHPGLMVGKVAGLAPYLLGGELGLGAKATTAGFGALMGGQSALDAQARVYDKPLEDLQKLPDYRPDQSEADNRARLAQQAARPAAALGAAAGVIPGAIAGKALHGPVTALLGGAEKVAASLPRTMAQGVLQQAPEFAAMNAGTTLAGNVGLRAVDPNQPLMENVPETVAEGLLVGGLSGMAVHPVMSRYQGNKGAKAYTAVLDQVHENRAAVPDTDLAKYVANGQELLSKTPMGKTPRADLLDAVTRTQQLLVDRQTAALARREAEIADYVKQQAPPIPPEATLDPTADPYGAMIQEAAQRDDLWNEQRDSLKRNVAHLEQLKQLRVEQDQRAQESARLEAARKVGEAQRQATTPTIPEGYDPTLDTVGRLPTSTLPPGYDPNPSASMGALGQLGPTRLGASQEPSPLVGPLGVKPPDAVKPAIPVLEQNPLDLLQQSARPDVVASAPLASEGQLPNGPNEMNRLLGNAPAPAKPPVSEVAPQTPDELLNRPARIQPREGTPDAAQSENAARPVGENQSVPAAADYGYTHAAGEGRADEVRPAESAGGQGQERPASQEQGQEVVAAPPGRAYASLEEQQSAIDRLITQAKQDERYGVANAAPMIRETVQFGAPEADVRQAIQQGEEAITDLADRWADKSNGMKMGFGQQPGPVHLNTPPSRPHPADKYANWNNLTDDQVKAFAYAMGIRPKKNRESTLSAIDDARQGENIRRAWDTAFPLATTPIESATSPTPEISHDQRSQGRQAQAETEQELAPAAEIPKPTAQNPNAAFNARQGDGGDAQLASRNEPTPDRTPPTREEVTQHLKDAVGAKDAQALLDSGRVRIHDDDSTVPEASRPAGRFAASVDKDGVAHFVLSEMDAATAKGVLAHESGHIGEKLGYFDAADRPVVKVAHAVLRVAGLEGLIGKPTFDNLVEQTRALADKGVASAKDAQDWVNHLVEKGLLDSADAGRELVSYTLEYAPNNLPLVKRIVATIRAALYRMGVKMQLTEADVLALARSALKSSAKEGRNELTRAGHLLNQMKNSPAFGSRAEFAPTAADRAEVERQMAAVREQYQNTPQWLKAPNGKPSKLNERQWVQVRTENFKRWFGDFINDPATANKVIDENGEPLVVFHSGNNDFSEIKIAAGSVGGIFALPDRPANYRDTSYPLFLRGEILSLEKMDDLISDQGDGGVGMFSKLLGRKIDDDVAEKLRDSLTNGEHYPDSDNELVWEVLGIIDEADAQKEIQKLRGKVAKELGFGSVQTPDEFDGETILIISPTDIKSAIGNIGTFSPDTGRIDYSRSRQADYSEDPAALAEFNRILAAQRAAVQPLTGGTDSRAFAEWFGDSAIKKRNGEPLPLYHGTSADFRAFDLDRGGSNTDHATAAIGVFMTPNARDAGRYGDRTLPLYARIEKPYVVNTWDLPVFELPDQARAFRAQLQAKGYDGMVIKSGADPYVVAFDGKQVKSSENQGTWSRETGDIYASRPNPLRLAQAAADKVAARLPESAKEFGRRILEEAQLWAAPMAVGTARTQAPAKDYANGVRQTWYEATKTLERLTKDFTPKQHKAMWNGMDATSVWVQQAMNGGMDRDAAMRAAQAQRVGVFALPAAQREAALALSTRADALWKRAKDAGMVQDDAQGLPFWTPRVAAIIGEDGSFGKPPSKNEGVQNPDHLGVGFTTTSPNLKHRGHVFATDSEAGMQKLFGDKAALVRDIRVMPLAMARLEQAIAGRELINQVKAIGKAIGAEVTSTSPKRGYFTLDHPAFQTFVPRIERQANGAWEQVQETVTDADGHTTLRPAFEKQPLYIAKEFEGPLRAVLNTRSGAIYQGLMGLKRGAMSLVMFSPMIHNAVIWGKAFPAMPGKMITGKIYFEGNRAKRDPALMKEAIGNGLAPINSGAFHPDVPTGLNSLSGHDAGLISTALSKGVGLVNKSAGAALAKGLDQLGGFWHNTMLWDRVADLQMGLYVNLKQHQMDKGLDAQSAGRVAAHFANRYAGAIPQEAMGEGARRLGNLALFSRSFTLGNLAIMKDMLTGLPQDVKAQILRDAGQGAMDQATAAARKKAWVMLAADIGLMYVGNALLQGAVDKLKLDKSLDEIGQGYARRLDKALKAADGNPLQLVNPWSAAFLPDRLSPGSEHEPGKEDRIFTGRDPRTGTASYTRLPTGKVGEELLRWPTRPLEMLRKKQSTLLRPTMEIFANRDHFNNPVYDADAPGLDGMVQRVGQVVGHFLSGQAPVEEAGAAYRSLTGQAVTGDTLKWAGPLMGFTAGRGYPGGPELGAIATAERRHADEIKAMRPEIKRLVDGGQVQEAVRKMTQLGMSPTAQRALIVSVVAPQSKLNSGALMRFYRNATVEEKAKLQDVIDAR